MNEQESIKNFETLSLLWSFNFTKVLDICFGLYHTILPDRITPEKTLLNKGDNITPTKLLKGSKKFHSSSHNFISVLKIPQKFQNLHQTSNQSFKNFWGFFRGEFRRKLVCSKTIAISNKFLFFRFFSGWDFFAFRPTSPSPSPFWWMMFIDIF